mmetsp:Transcript_37007/g.56741  ORF Transcript_37007/g.56741 Transcript_37007/m.56741 type:complete len:224 (-) Transcript_37007:1333-2004(-)
MTGVGHLSVGVLSGLVSGDNLVGVSFGVVTGVNALGVFILSEDLEDLLVEGRRSELGLAVVEVHVDGQAVNGGEHSLVEESEEDGGGNEGQESHHDNRPSEGVHLGGIADDVGHRKVHEAAVKGNDHHRSNEHEEGGELVGEVELDAVLQVDQEAVPGRGAVALAGDGHECVGELRQVLNHVLEATSAAESDGSSDLGSGVVGSSTRVSEGLHCHSNDGENGV